MAKGIPDMLSLQKFRLGAFTTPVLFKKIRFQPGLWRYFCGSELVEVAAPINAA
jgi:hypothetical protein